MTHEEKCQLARRIIIARQKEQMIQREITEMRKQLSESMEVGEEFNVHLGDDRFVVSWKFMKRYWVPSHHVEAKNILKIAYKNPPKEEQVA